MLRLRPLSKTLLPQVPVRSTERLSEGMLLPLPSATISGQATSPKPSKLRQVTASSRSRILDFDVETVAAGFADPEWVPQKITCVAWSWIGEDPVHVRIATVDGLYTRPELRAKMLQPLVEAIGEADMVTGHNILRFDLPVINSECMRLGMPKLRKTLVQDTIRIVRSKGFKKGQANLAKMLNVPADKLGLDWQHWDDAYAEVGWPTVQERARTDVMQHKLIRAEMVERGMIRAPRLWCP